MHDFVITGCLYRLSDAQSLLDVGVNQEFRIVRDNRMNNNEDMEKKTELAQHRAPEHEESISNVPEKRSKFFAIP